MNRFQAYAESDKQKKYQEFFQKKLKKWGVKSPNELPKDKKDDFFEEIKKDWKG